MSEQLLTKREVAAHLRCSTKTVESLCSRRELPFIQLPGRKLFDPSDVRMFLSARRIDGGNGKRQLNRGSVTFHDETTIGS